MARPPREKRPLRTRIKRTRTAREEWATLTKRRERLLARKKRLELYSTNLNSNYRIGVDKIARLNKDNPQYGKLYDELKTILRKKIQVEIYKVQVQRDIMQTEAAQSGSQLPWGGKNRELSKKIEDGFDAAIESEKKLAEPRALETQIWESIQMRRKKLF